MSDLLFYRNNRPSPTPTPTPAPVHRASPERRERGFAMMALLLAALCAFMVLAMVADMQLIAHVQNRKFRQDIQTRVTSEHLVIVAETNRK